MICYQKSGFLWPLYGPLPKLNLKDIVNALTEITGCNFGLGFYLLLYYLRVCGSAFIHSLEKIEFFYPHGIHFYNCSGVNLPLKYLVGCINFEIMLNHNILTLKGNNSLMFQMSPLTMVGGRPQMNGNGNSQSMHSTSKSFVHFTYAI